MIGFLRGVLAHKAPPFLLIDVNGVGYELEVPMSTVFHLPDPGSRVELLTHLVVREDAQILFGFNTAEERGLFRSLLKVNGVGAKLALAILSGISVESFAQCVRNEDKATLVRLPGVGRKTAERLILDMRDRIETDLPVGENGATPPPAGVGSVPRTEAFNALISLGYKPGETQKMLDAVSTDGVTTEDILRQVLRSVAP
jgi:Holliday junction DNA helicase RuvA